MAFAKVLIAWCLSLAVYTAILMAWLASNGEAESGFIEALSGLGILLAVPTFFFAFIVAWPVTSLLDKFRPVLLMPIIAGAVLAAIMWVLTALMLPEGWRGAGHALIGYAAVLGLVWGCLDLITAPASALLPESVSRP